VRKETEAVVVANRRRGGTRNFWRRELESGAHRQVENPGQQTRMGSLKLRGSQQKVRPELEKDLEEKRGGRKLLGYPRKGGPKEDLKKESRGCVPVGSLELARNSRKGKGGK